MRFSYSLILSTLMVVYLLSDNVLGDAKIGRYTWLKCTPGSKNANCVKNQGPVINLPAPQRLPARATRDIHPVETSEETEESGEGSGDFLSREVREISMKEWPQQSLTEEEGSGIEYVDPELVQPKLSARDLREDNMIE
ncbi:serglycin [Clarias gariepinus]|uniref:serglycin n=1 Tax=Clarias gariepinus TaxID=13013 RepID=UPI00234C37AE|nr:serglycin [Clarias gariepinus]